MIIKLSKIVKLISTPKLNNENFKNIKTVTNIKPYKNYMLLSKYSLSKMNASMCLMGYLLSSPACIMSTQPTALFISSFMLACSSQGFGQILEREKDKLMIRTRNRPIVTNKINIQNGIIFSSFNYIAANLIFLNYFNVETIITGNIIFFSYLFLYIPIKLKTIYNTEIGAVIGGFPIILGGFAGGSSITASTLSLSLYMMSWQLPHFYAILWTYRFDYDKAGFCMIKDHKIASLKMKISLLIQSLSVNYIYLDGKLGILCCLLTNYYILIDLYKAINKFKDNPNIGNSKVIKYSSYKGITALVLGILFNLSGINFDDKILNTLLKDYLKF